MTNLLAVFLGATLAGLFGIAGAHVAAKRENTRWLRQERLAAYVDMLHAFDHRVSFLVRGAALGVESLTSDHPDFGLEVTKMIETVDLILRARSRIVILGPTDVARAAEELADALVQKSPLGVASKDQGLELQSRRKAFHQAAQASLGITARLRTT